MQQLTSHLVHVKCISESTKSSLIGVLLLLILSTSFVSSDSSSNTNAEETPSSTFTSPRIAIIGSGLGGSSAAYHLHKLLKGNVHLVVFDENSVIGGRVATCKVLGNEYETGGSFIHPKNQLADNLAKELKLRQRNASPNPVTSIMNGKGEFVFSTSSWQLVTLWRVLERYGFDRSKLKKMANSFTDNLQAIYKLQSASRYFDSVDEMLKTLSINTVYNVTRSHFDKFLSDQGMSELFINELVNSVTYGDYGQSAKMHSFAGLMAASGLTSTSGIWSVEGGNKHLPIAMLNNTEARVQLKTKIQAIIQLPDGTLKLSTDSLGQSVVAGNFDKVIIAAPMSTYLQTQPLKFINFANELNDQSKFAQKYHRTVTTIVAAKSITEKYKIWLDISVSDPFFFNSLTRVYPVQLSKAEKMPIYKVLSPEPLTDGQLNELFRGIVQKEVVDRLAYPEYDKVPPKLGSFVLHPKVYYLNPIEMAASTMEMSLISGRNAALSIAASLKKGRRPNSGETTGNLKTEL